MKQQHSRCIITEIHSELFTCLPKKFDTTEEDPRSMLKIYSKVVKRNSNDGQNVQWHTDHRKFVRRINMPC